MKSPDGILRFGEFTLDPANRRLSRGAEPVEIGGRYLDALVLLASAPGQLISKDRLHDEVWRGVPVTDEALSQAIMALRRALGDDATRPRFIETVPRHGYRFVGTVDQGASRFQATLEAGRSETLALITDGVGGAIVAGLLVGLVYGSLASGSGTGHEVSLIMVLVCVSMLAALVSGLGIAGGIGTALRQGGADWWRPVGGGALGGLAVGGLARLLGSDTLRLLMGGAPDRMAGAIEGLVMGCMVGFGLWFLARHQNPLRFGLVALLGGLAGLLLVACGGVLMAGSLAALVTRFPGAALSMTWTDTPLLLALSGFFEGSLFAVLVCAGMARRAR